MLMGGMGIVWILILAGVAFLFKENFQRKAEDSVTNQTSAVEILKQRYAKGDIDRHTFEQTKKDLL